MVQPLFNVDALPIVAGELSLGAGRQLDRFHLEGDFRIFLADILDYNFVFRGDDWDLAAELEEIKSNLGKYQVILLL